MLFRKNCILNLESGIESDARRNDVYHVYYNNIIMQWLEIEFLEIIFIF